MIPFNFEYYKPSTIEEAIELFTDLDSQNKKPKYYSGGTEIITLGRLNKIQTGALIDIKDIKECNILEETHKSIIMGAGVSLSKISDTNIFPLLSKVNRTLADRTSRNKITLGGNICGSIPYKEAMLPLFLSNSIVKIAGPKGKRDLDINEFFNTEKKLQEGEFITQIITDKKYKDLPFHHIKKTRQANVDYPLISASFIKDNKSIKFALSGMCNTPFRSIEMEDILNKSDIKLKEKVAKIIDSIKDPIVDNALGSAEYRKFVLGNVILESMEKLGED